MKVLAEYVVIGPKGKIVIPAQIRRKLDLRAGSNVFVREDNGKITLVKPGTDAFIDALQGSLGDTSSLIEQLRRDREREDAHLERRWKRHGQDTQSPAPSPVTSKSRQASARSARENVAHGVSRGSARSKRGARFSGRKKR